MVLAERASQVTAEASHGQDPAARVESFQGLFLNGIQGHRGELAIIFTDDCAIHVFPGAAESPLARPQAAMVYAYVTGYFHWDMNPPFRLDLRYHCQLKNANCP